MKTKPKIYADFQKLDNQGRLILSCSQSHIDIKKQQLRLQKDLEVVFYSDDCDNEGNDDELRVDGKIDYSENIGEWLGVYDASKFRHASDEL